MSKSRARFLSELLGTTGLVKKAKSALAGADEVIDLDVLPSIPNSKLTNSSITINSSATSLGGSVTLTTANVAENTNLYYTNARADARIVNAGSANWNTAYTYSQVGHLPLAGGTLTGNLSLGIVTANSGGGNASLGSHLDLGDNQKARFGASDDLQIYHSGSHSFISEGGTGDLYIGASSNIALMNAAFSENKLLATTDGALKLYYDGSQKFATTSTGIDVTGEVEATALDINGNGDISGNLTLGGYLAGPATFTIDPAAVGDNTGTVVIAGNLQVDGTTTTINSTTMTVDDLNLTLASGAANAAAANGAGITVDGASATLTYDGTNDTWVSNKLFISDSGGVDAAQFRANYGSGNYLDIKHNSLNAVTSGGQSFVIQYGGTTALTIDSSRNSVFAGNITSGKINTTATEFRWVYSTDNNVGVLVRGETYTADEADITATRLQTGNTTTLGLAGQEGINFYTAGVETMRINASGDVGIGTSGGNGRRLDVLTSNDYVARFASSDGYAGIIIEDSGSTANYNRLAVVGNTMLFDVNNLTRMKIDSTGNVGIGETDPDSKLHVKDATNISASAAGAGQFRVEGNGYTTSIAMDATRAHIYHNSSLRNLSFGTDESIDMTIKGSNGYVGIGTENPLYKLHVSGAGSQRLLIEKTDAGGDADLQFRSQDDSTQWILFNDTDTGNNSGVIKYVHSTNKMHFRTNDVDDRLVLSSDGNVGIGTPSPESLLTLENDDATLRIRSATTTTKGLTLRYNDSGNFGQLLVDHQGNNQLAMKYYALSHSFGRSDSDVNITMDDAGRLLVGSATTDASSSERFLVKSTGGNHSRFVNSSDTFTTVYIKNTSTTANTNQPFLTFQDTGGNRGNFGLRYSTSQLVIQGHGGVGIAGGSGFTQDPDLFVNSSGRVGVGTTAIDANSVLDVEGNMVVNTASGTGYGEGGIFFRRNYTTSYLYNVSILTYAHDGSGGFSDGLSINGYDGVSFCTGSNTRQERMRIVGGTGSTSGNVGIGTTDQIGEKLTVNGSVQVLGNNDPNYSAKFISGYDSTHGLRITTRINDTTESEVLGVFANSGGAAPRLVLNPTNGWNVGIGETTPDGPLHVKGSTNRTIIADSTFSSGSFTTLAFRRNGSDKWRMTQQSDDSHLSFYNDAIGGYQMSLADDGRVGIGVTAPAGHLDVRFSGRNGIYVGSTNGAGSFLLLDGAGNGDGAGGDYAYIEHNSSGNLIFNVGNSGNSTAEKMRIEAGGNVGIGTNNPGEKLVVYNSTVSGNTTLHVHNDKTGDAAVLRLEGKRTSTNDNAQILFANNGSIGSTIRSYSGGDDGDIRFYTSLSGTGNTTSEALRIQANGDIHFGGPSAGRIKHSGTSVYIDAIPTNSHIIFRNDGSVEKMHITDTGSLYHVEQGSDGDYTSYIGSVNHAGSSNRYIHVNISTTGGDMFWIEAIGYDYGGRLIYGRAGGYIYNQGNQTAVYSGIVSGSIVTQYELSNGTLEIVIDTISTGTGNRWGSIVLRGGTDTITATQPLEVIQYSKTSSTTKVY